MGLSKNLYIPLRCGINAINIRTGKKNLEQMFNGGMKQINESK